MKLSLGPPIQALQTAWTWWLAETLGLIEAALGWKNGARRTPVARVFPDGDYSLRGPEGGAASKATGRRVAVSLPTEWVVRQRVDLPIAAASRARDAIGFMIDRLSPFPRDQVFFAVQVVGVDRAKRTAQVEVAITPRVRTQLVVARLTEQGLFPHQVEVSGADLARPFIFEGAAMRGESSRADRFVRWIAVSALILVALAAPALVVATDWQAKALEEEAQALRPAAERARTLSDELAAHRKAKQEWRAFAQAPQLCDVLETLTQRVDDTAWVFSVEYDREVLTLHGLAHDVPALLARLSAPPFGTGALVGAILSGSNGEGDRFDAKLPLLEAAR